MSVIETNKMDFSTSYITENKLEEYISKKLELIEDGLKLIKRQFEVSGGTIDILAKDKNGTICIVELKIAEDKSIVWQVLHYPLQIKKIYNIQEVRMITVAPSYSPHILSALKMSKNIECYDYNITTEGKEISELKLRKVVWDLKLNRIQKGCLFLAPFFIIHWMKMVVTAEFNFLDSLG